MLTYLLLSADAKSDSLKKRNHPFKGIRFQNGKWSAKVWINGAYIYPPGTFSTEGEAAAVYDSYARAYGLVENNELR